MATTTLRTGSISVDTTDFRTFARDLRRASPVLAKSLRTKLREAGEIVADDARERASFSKTILPTIRTRTSGATVSVIAKGTLAGLEELGSKGTPGLIRHPLFGNKKHWYIQKAHPFLKPAIETKGREATDRIFEALDEAWDIIKGDG